MAAMFQHEPSKRLKRLGLGLHALGLSIVLATAGLGYALAIHPLENRIDEVDDHSFQLEGLLRDAPKVRGQHQRLQNEIAAARASVADLHKRVPDEPFEADFLAQLTEAANQSGLRIGDYRPGVVRGGQRCSQLQVQLSCQGTYQSVCEFPRSPGGAPPDHAGREARCHRRRSRWSPGDLVAGRLLPAR